MVRTSTIDARTDAGILAGSAARTRWRIAAATTLRAAVDAAERDGRGALA